MIFGHFLGAKGHHQQDVSSRLGMNFTVGVPATDQLIRQFVRPLAVVEQDQRRAFG